VVRDTFKLLSARTEDAGVYRCRVIGCTQSNVFYTESVLINIGVVTEVVQQPSNIFTCVGDSLLSRELATIVSEAGDRLPSSYR
jgi:Asp/Glu/hydantoin racemase